MSKRTQTIDIFGKKIKVFYKNSALNKEDTYRGYFDSENWVIYIDARMSKPDQLQTLIHELIHAVFNRTGIHQTNLNQNIEEIICENISEMLTANFNITQKLR